MTVPVDSRPLWQRALERRRREKALRGRLTAKARAGVRAKPEPPSDKRYV